LRTKARSALPRLPPSGSGTVAGSRNGSPRDPEADAEVFRRFAAMAEERTAVLVSHRLGSARLCGTGYSCSRAGGSSSRARTTNRSRPGGVYARLWALQSRAYQ